MNISRHNSPALQIIGQHHTRYSTNPTEPFESQSHSPYQDKYDMIPRDSYKSRSPFYLVYIGEHSKKDDLYDMKGNKLFSETFIQKTINFSDICISNNIQEQLERPSYKASDMSINVNESDLLMDPQNYLMDNLSVKREEAQYIIESVSTEIRDNIHKKGFDWSDEIIQIFTNFMLKIMITEIKASDDKW